MIGKVKLTREQAEGIEVFLADYDNDISDCIDWHAVNWRYKDSWNKEYKSFSDLSHSDLARALLIGYEVKEEYKVGDWIAFRTHDNRLLVCIIENVYEWNVDTDYVGSNGCKQNFSKAHIRHATHEEIEFEKKRRIFSGIGRKVAEFKHGDIGQTVEGVVIISKKQMEQAYTHRNLRGFFPIESYILLGDGVTND